jgi:hypothetical protein
MAPVKRPVAVVVWDDAHGSVNKDIDPDNIPDHKPMVMTTMGWLLADNDKGVYLAMEKFLEDGKDWYRGTTFIPRGMVRSTTMFTLGRVRTKKVEDLPKEVKKPGSEPKRSNPLPRGRVL